MFDTVYARNKFEVTEYSFAFKIRNSAEKPCSCWVCFKSHDPNVQLRNSNGPIMVSLTVVFSTASYK